MTERQRVFQLTLKEIEIPPNAVYIGEGSPIWPMLGGMGYLCKGIFANRLKGKIHGLTGFQCRSPMILHMGEIHWTLPKDTKFATYSENAKKTIPLAA